MRLNLGCGATRIPGYYGVDFRKIKLDGCVDIEADLNKRCWHLWEDNSIDAIYSSHCLEHLADPINAIREMHRILKVGGKIKIIVPHASSTLAYARTHVTRFTTVWFFSWCQLYRGQGEFEDDPQLFEGRVYWTFLSDTMAFKENRSWMLKFIYYSIKYAITPLEWFINRSVILQFMWEKLSIFGPDELVFEGTKMHVRRNYEANNG